MSPVRYYICHDQKLKWLEFISFVRIRTEHVRKTYEHDKFKSMYVCISPQQDKPFSIPSNESNYPNYRERA